MSILLSIPDPKLESRLVCPASSGKKQLQDIRFALQMREDCIGLVFLGAGGISRHILEFLDARNVYKTANICPHFITMIHQSKYN